MNTSDITALQQERTLLWHDVPPQTTLDGLAGLVEQNHLQNFCLWHEEDVARRDDLGSERVRQAKRAIDRYNQCRNDLIESIDMLLVEELNPSDEGVPFNSETPGMMIDRLSILALKKYHMAEEADRANATEDHRTQSSAKLRVIDRQIDDLRQALTELLFEVGEGTRSFRVHYQFKMYNDAALNPELRKAS